MYAISEMLSLYKGQRCHASPTVLHFILPNGRIVGSQYDELDPETGELVTQTLYNCSAPYRDILAVRQDPLNSECGCIILARRFGNFWLLDGPKITDAQDPSIMVVDGIPIITYNKFEMNALKQIVRVCQYFCLLSTPDIPFAIGQPGEKGGRLLRRIKGIIPVMGRRQDWPTMRGQLTYTEIHHLSELEGALREAPIVEGINDNNAWVGANQLISLGQNNEYIGVFMHFAELDASLLSRGIEEKSYFAAAGVFNRIQRRMVAMEIILDAEDLPFTRITKMAQLRRVIYPGGLCRDRRTAGGFRMYAGANDYLCFETRVEIKAFSQYAAA